MGRGRSVDVKQSFKEGQTLSLRGLCEGRENRGSVPIGEASDSARGRTMVQDPSKNEWKRIWRVVGGMGGH